MLKFLTGLATGVVLAGVSVRFDLALPAIFDLPDKVKKNVVSAAVEGDLYDLGQAEAVRGWALAIHFKNRAGDALKANAAAGHPFLNALHVARARGASAFGAVGCVRQGGCYTALPWGATCSVAVAPV